MLKQILVSAFIFVIVLMAGCASFKHDVLMKGQILDVKDDVVTLCIGHRDGARPGDLLEVKRSVFKKGVVLTEEGESNFELVDVGKIKIQKITNDHYAVAKVISGDIRAYDVAEMEK